MSLKNIIVNLLTIIGVLLSFSAQGQVLKDSIYYSPDTVLMRYFVVDNNIIMKRTFAPILRDEDVYTSMKDNRLYYYNLAGSFSRKDSIYAHGEINIIDWEKPYEDEIQVVSSTYDYLDRGGISTILPSSNTKGKCYKGLREGIWMFNTLPFAKIEEHYTTGIRDGKYTVYTKQDSILYQTNFDKGTGVEHIYRDSSDKYSLYHIKYFKDGKQDYDYPLKEFYSRGTLARFVDYKNGIEEEYYLNEKPFIRTEGIFELNENKEMVQKKGKKFYFNEEGDLVRTDIFNENESTSIHYDEKGKIKKIHSGNMVQHFKKGKLISTFIEGKKVEIK